MKVNQLDDVGTVQYPVCSLKASPESCGSVLGPVLQLHWCPAYSELHKIKRDVITWANELVFYVTKEAFYQCY